MKILIVGGVAGGAAFAARARRLNENADIIIFERGEYVSFANCGLPYYAGDVIKKRNSLLLETTESFKKQFNIEVRIHNEVVAIDRKNKKIDIQELKTGKLYSENYDFLMLSPGAEPFKPNIPGIELPFVHFVRTVPDIDRIKNYLNNQKIKSAVVVGGGYIGIEMAENLKERGIINLHVIEMTDQILPPFDKDMAIILQRYLTENSIHLHLNERVINITDDGNVHTSSNSKIKADIVIVSVGVTPEIKLAKDCGLSCGQKGISTNAKMQTSDPSIYAVGDVVETENPVMQTKQHVPLAGPAAKQAVIAANNISGIECEYKGTIGTAILKVFSLSAAITGCSEKILQAQQIPYEKIYTFPLNHAGYYPGASLLNIKILFTKESGTVLGAQIVGKEGTDKRIDILAISVQHKMTMKDLADFELAYAPPYGSGKDAINLAGMSAQNHLTGIAQFLHWDSLSGEEFFLDVRTPREYEKGTVNNCLNIPLSTLRNRINEIPKNKKIAVFCMTGVRSHYATRILIQNGYQAYNLSGGYLTYRNYMETK